MYTDLTHRYFRSIPTDRELSKMEKLVCEPEVDGTLLYEWCHVTNPIRLSNNKYYFSAAAVAIDFRKFILHAAG